MIIHRANRSAGDSALHHGTQFGFIELGLAAALIAKIPADRIINFLPLADLRKWVANVRAKR